MILETERFVDEKRRHGFTYIRKQIIRCKGKIDNARERYIKKKKKKKKKKNRKWKWYELKVDLKTSILNMIDKYLEMIIVT